MAKSRKLLITVLPLILSIQLALCLSVFVWTAAFE